MAIRMTAAGLMLLWSGSAVSAETIEGTIVVARKLTKPRVTPGLPLYVRGAAVELGTDPPDDPLAFERSRVAVYLDGAGPMDSAAAAITATLEQENRRFAQDTVVVPAGSTVSFPNKDPIFHNVFSLSKTKIFDLGNYAKGETRTVKFLHPGIVFVNCHLHTNMAAAIVVTPNRWSAKAARDGHFSLRDVPPGTYTIVAWHKAAGFVRKKVEVVAGKDAHVEILVPLEENAATPPRDAGESGPRLRK